MTSSPAARRTAREPKAASFWIKVAAVAALVAVIPLLGVGLVVDNVNESALREAHRTMLDLALDNVASTAQAATDATDAALGAVGSALVDRSAPTDDARITAAQAAAAVRQLSAVGIYDGTGAHIDTIRVDTGHAAPPLPATLPALATAAYGAVQFLDGKAFVMRRALVRGGASSWSVATMSSLAPLVDKVTSLAAHGLPPGTALVVATREQVAVADAAGERVGLRVDGTEFGVLAGIGPEALANEFLLDGEFERADGTRVISALRTIERTPFAVIAEIPTKVAFRSLGRVRKFVVLAVAIAIASALGAGILLARRVTRPITALVDYADEIANRRFGSRVTIRTKDELGVLGLALERAATELAASDEKLLREAAIRSDLGRYLPNQLVDQIVSRQRVIALGGERRDVTVLFADVVGFTPLAEREPAETVVTLLNELFTILTELVFRHGGTVDKFIGDSVMAVWGAPEPSTDHASRALQAAIEMQRWLETSNESWLERFGIRIELAIGVNSGEAVVGNFGSETRMEYTAIGDIVNVAARLEAIARPGQILTTRGTKDRARDGFAYVALGPRALVGKADVVELYEVRQ